MYTFLILIRTDVIMKEKSRSRYYHFIIDSISDIGVTIIIVAATVALCFFKVFNYLLVFFVDCWNFLLYLPMLFNLTVLEMELVYHNWSTCFCTTVSLTQHHRNISICFPPSKWLPIWLKSFQLDSRAVFVFYMVQYLGKVCWCNTNDDLQKQLTLYRKFYP